MIKIKFIFLLTLIISITGYSDIFQSLNSGNPITDGPVESSIVIKNRIGDIFFVYITNNDLVVLKQNQEENLSFVVEPVYAINNLNNFRDITINTWPDSYEYIWFIAEKDSIEGLYALTFDDECQLVLLSENQLTLDGLNGNITRYVIQPDIHSTFLIPYIKGVVCLEYTSY